VFALTQTLEHMLFTLHVVTVSFKKVQFKTVCKDDILHMIKANVKVDRPTPIY